MSEFKMTEGEKMIWSDAYMRARSAQRHEDEVDIRMAAREAAREVMLLRSHYESVAEHLNTQLKRNRSDKVLGMLNEMLGKTETKVHKNLL